MTEKSKKLITASLSFILGVAVGGTSVFIAKKYGSHEQTVPSAKTVDMVSAADYDAVYKKMNEFKHNVWESITSWADGYANSGAKSTGTDFVYESAASDEYSKTNVQVEGVDEADTVKTDGKFIYIIKSNYDESEKMLKTEIKTVDIRNGEPARLKSISIDGFKTYEMYLSEGRIIVIGTENTEKDSVKAVIYDISNPDSPKKIQECTQSGVYSESRLIGGKLYIISNYYIETDNIKKYSPKTYVPALECKNYNGTVKPDSICFYNECSSPEYTVLSAYDIKDGSLVSTQSVLGGSYTVYASTENIITSSYPTNGKIQITRFSANGGNIELAASGELNGELLNQFSIDEYKEHFRFVLTSQSSKYSGNSLVILDKDLKETGAIKNIAEGERVYSVRFMGDTAYFVTFRQVDPLFSADVSDPTEPKIISSLKIPGFSNYLFPFGDGKLFGIGQNADEKTGRTTGMKISMFDISDPANVTECAKTDLNAPYSEALSNHKATLTDSNKNLIGFPAYGGANNTVYYIFSFEDGKFVKKAEVDLPYINSGCRGLYANGNFYIAAPDKIYYSPLSELDNFKSSELK
ncbi:MAG: beta-propeller domain-containing protein [Acutalibacteraceae bacterium]|nr:beta-propeller domain-containing protein [Acutalibacteraceae bacterium]